MKYVNAAELLPDVLLKELQEYIQGSYLYIPIVSKKRKCWGEMSGYRKELLQRNNRIMAEYQRGATVEELADRYFLSSHTIRKIIYTN